LSDARSAAPAFPSAARGRRLSSSGPLWRATTVLGCVKSGVAALGADGQVTLGDVVVKTRARKLRKLGDGQVLAGFAGAAGDALALLDRLEEQVQKHPGQLERACIGLVKAWRTDRMLHRLDATLAVLDRKRALIVTGTGEIVEPDDGLLAIGSGAAYALAAARALARHTKLAPEALVREGLRIAGEICIYTNLEIELETLT
jgi:ATP-dependent HslUV protease subunit HslV